ncbi:MAG TPA: hypothetical protein VMW77_10040 [Methanoregula sp.]|nr:hypothetical protein [Methanoregula sp.]
MDTDKIAQAFKSAEIEKTITCPEAFSIAAKFGIPKKEISEYCNTHGIKIRGCQLGCFK